MYSMVTTFITTTLYTCKLLGKQILNIPTTLTKRKLHEVMEVLANSKMVAILQYMCIKSKHLHVNYISVKLGEGQGR